MLDCSAGGDYNGRENAGDGMLPVTVKRRWRDETEQDMSEMLKGNE